MTSRAEAAAHVMAILDEPLATAGLGYDAAGQRLADPDVPGHLKEPLDAADVAFGYVEETDEAARGEAYLALAEFHVLQRIRRRIALRFDVTTGGDVYRLSQAVGQIERLIAVARERALALAGATAVAGGPVVDKGSSLWIGGLTVDWSGARRHDGEEYGRW